MSDDAALDQLAAEVDGLPKVRVAAVVCISTDPLVVSLDGLGEVRGVEVMGTFAEGDTGYAFVEPGRLPLCFKPGGGGGGGVQGLFGSGVDQSGSNANAGGDSTVANVDNAFAIGQGSQATGIAATAEGSFTTASGDHSHAEGRGTTASGPQSHAEGDASTASGQASHAEGRNTQASGQYAHAEGLGAEAAGDFSHAEGTSSATESRAHAEGSATTASGQQAHSEGDSTVASGDSSHAEGISTTASGDGAHAEGDDTIASGAFSHIQGDSGHAFRALEDSTSAAIGPVTLQKTELNIVSNWPTGDIQINGSTDPIMVPVHGGHFDGKITIWFDEFTDRWDITFRGSNDATDFAGRDSGTVTIDASAGGSTLVYGTSTITWDVTGDSAGNVLITPSATTAGIDRWAHVELFELYANT